MITLSDCQTQYDVLAGANESEDRNEAVREFRELIREERYSPFGDTPEYHQSFA